MIFQIPYEMITFVQRCIFKYLNKQQTAYSETDFWKFESHKEVWNEFMEHYTKLINDDYSSFFNDYTYNIEVRHFIHQYIIKVNMKYFIITLKYTIKWSELQQILTGLH